MRYPHCLGALLIASLAGSIASPSKAEAKSVRAKAKAKLSAEFKKMKSKVYKARMSGCGAWECDDGTVYFKFPNKIDIRYDKPYGSRVISDGKELSVYNNNGDKLTTSSLGDTSLGLLLKGELEGDVEVASVETIDLGPRVGEPRRVYSIQLMSTDEESSARPITLLFAKKSFRFLGWRVSGRSNFTIILRDLRPLNRSSKLPKRLFTIPAEVL